MTQLGAMPQSAAPMIQIYDNQTPLAEQPMSGGFAKGRFPFFHSISMLFTPWARMRLINSLRE